MSAIIQDIPRFTCSPLSRGALEEIRLFRGDEAELDLHVQELSRKQGSRG